MFTNDTKKYAIGQTLGRRQAAVKVAMLADSYATMSSAHAGAAAEKAEADDRETALRLVGQAQAFLEISRRLIDLAQELNV